MAFYEHTFIGKQDLTDKEIEGLISKYSDIINKTGKILKNKERKAFEIQRITTDVLIAETINLQ